MIGVLVGIHVAISLFLVLAVLLQQGKGASMGVLGGAGQSWFGPSGSKSLLMKITIGLAVAFLLNSILLSLAATERAVMPPQQQSAPAQQPDR
jgi:preprotein translocase subunit SecG